MNNPWTVTCPFCDTVHDAAESIECSCGAHGHRQGIGWVWITKPGSTPVDENDDIHCNCFPKYSHKVGGKWICDDCGKPIRS